MVRVYIPQPDRYLKRVRPDKPLRELYGEYDDGELRGLVGVTVQGFNALRLLSAAERQTKPVDGWLNSIFGSDSYSYTQATCVFGKPELVERATQMHDMEISIPINGQPFLDHEYGQVGEYFQQQRVTKGVVAIDTTGNVIGARRIAVPQGFELNGASEEITAVRGSVNPEHVQAAHASENGLSSIVLAKDGSVITFLGGYPVRDLTYKPGEKFVWFTRDGD